MKATQPYFMFLICSSQTNFWEPRQIWDINETQVFELSCAQREAEQRRTADSASAQESLLAVSAK